VGHGGKPGQFGVAVVLAPPLPCVAIARILYLPGSTVGGIVIVGCITGVGPTPGFHVPLLETDSLALKVPSLLKSIHTCIDAIDEGLAPILTPPGP